MQGTKLGQPRENQREQINQQEKFQQIENSIHSRQPDRIYLVKNPPRFQGTEGKGVRLELSEGSFKKTPDCL